MSAGCGRAPARQRRPHDALHVEIRIEAGDVIGDGACQRRSNFRPAWLIYKRTGNLRAVQLLLAHTKIESTVRYLGIEVDDALEIAEQTDV